MNRMLKGILPAMIVLSIMASIVAVQAQSYAGTVRLTGSGTIWEAGFICEAEDGKVQIKVPQRLMDLMGIGKGFEIETNGDPYVRDGYTMYVTSDPSALAEFEALLEGDVNGDDVVDIADLTWIARALGTDLTYPHGTGWNQYNPYADVNVDGKVDALDLVITGSHFEND